MKDKWMNAGYEGEELKPHVEPVEDYNDASRIGERSAPASLPVRPSPHPLPPRSPLVPPSFLPRSPPLPAACHVGSSSASPIHPLPVSRVT